MTTFLRLLSDKDKSAALQETVQALRSGARDERLFTVEPEAFRQVPGAPFAYWVSDAVRETFERLPAFESGTRTVKQGLATADDFRFVRAWWEIECLHDRWFPFAKGGKHSRYFADLGVTVNWYRNGQEIKAWAGSLYNNSHWSRILKNVDWIGQPGLTWPLRGITFSAQAVPTGGAFSVAGKMAFAPREQLGKWLALFNSKPFDYLIQLFAGKVGGVQYEVGLIGGVPVPGISDDKFLQLEKSSHRAWSLKRTLDTITETSHAFLLPAALRARCGDYDPPAIEAELARIQAEIDAIAFDLYGFSEADRRAATGTVQAHQGTADEDEDDDNEAETPATDGLLSWAVGVAFGRFDWRLATGERQAPPEPDPFDPLPAKSPGMLPVGAQPFHAHAGILVDDPGHPHDLARLVEDVLERVDAPVPSKVRRWLQRDFFPFHLKQYSRSRRKAPIYWPLSTPSGSYTLWVHYPDLDSQTLYTAINDFLEPKLGQVSEATARLRNKGTARDRAEEKRFEELQTFELELTELRDTLLKLAPNYRPNHDDGVQITSAPLWPLFRHKPWQKVLKDTWTKLEKGDYDWAHLAMNYWSERVREKCRTDKSLAIAHGLEELYVEPETKPKKARGRKKGT